MIYPDIFAAKSWQKCRTREHNATISVLYLSFFLSFSPSLLNSNFVLNFLLVAPFRQRYHRFPFTNRAAHYLRTSTVAISRSLPSYRIIKFLSKSRFFFLALSVSWFMAVMCCAYFLALGNERRLK